MYLTKIMKNYECFDIFELMKNIFHLERMEKLGIIICIMQTLLKLFKFMTNIDSYFFVILNNFYIGKIM